MSHRMNADLQEYIGDESMSLFQADPSVVDFQDHDHSELKFCAGDRFLRVLEFPNRVPFLGRNAKPAEGLSSTGLVCCFNRKVD